MTSLTQAQDLLKRWREAAGSESSAFLTLWLSEAPVFHQCLLHWTVSTSVHRESVSSCPSADPLTSVREAIKATPWASVGDGEPIANEPVAAVRLDNGYLSYESWMNERLRLKEGLASRDARIEELTAESADWERAYDLARANSVQAESERDAAREQYQGLMSFEETLRRLAFRECASAKMIAECKFAEKLLNEFRVILDRFPPIDETEGEAK